MGLTLYTAIIFTNVPQIGTGAQFLKYRNINNQAKFENFARKFPGAVYINWYEKTSRRFIKRVYLNQ